MPSLALMTHSDDAGAPPVKLDIAHFPKDPLKQNMISFF